MQQITLYRPIGPAMHEAILQSNAQSLSSLLLDQRILFPVLDEDYALQMAREWYLPHHGKAWLCSFTLPAHLLENIQRQRIGEHEELRIPREELELLNQHLIGKIRISQKLSISPQDSALHRRIFSKHSLVASLQAKLPADQKPLPYLMMGF